MSPTSVAIRRFASTLERGEGLSTRLWEASSMHGRTDVTDVVDRLLAQAARTPDGIAVAGERPTTYAEFVRRVAAFAARFEELETPRVLIALEKGADAYAAMFGTLMAGGTYAPVNVSSPEARLRHIAGLFLPHLVVAEPHLAAPLAQTCGATIVDMGALQGGGLRAAAPRAAAGSSPATLAPASLAYVIFTSGSTGAPKGVAISRAALAHYVDWAGPAMRIQPGDRMSQHPNIGFDLSVLDIYGALCFGAALHPFVRQSARLLPARKVRDDALTIWNSVPSVISAMITAGELDATHLGSVRLFTFCGELLRYDQVANLFAACPDAVVLNTYGPTEATVAMTCRRLTADQSGLCRPSAPLGEAIGDMRLDLVGGLDEGEIAISGSQLASGYYGDDVLTATKFRDLARADGTVRAFFTGDYAARIGGELYFLGRRDDMVKLHGHRIHLGEIREALHKLGWSDAFVFEEGGRILAMVERTKGLVFDERRILTELGDLLDSYFVPSAVRCAEHFPRTANDKLDSAALKAVFETAQT